MGCKMSFYKYMTGFDHGKQNYEGWFFLQGANIQDGDTSDLGG